MKKNKFIVSIITIIVVIITLMSFLYDNSMAADVGAMTTGADLVMSGFLEADIPIIRSAAEAEGLLFVSSRLRDGWAAVHCKKR